MASLFGEGEFQLWFLANSWISLEDENRTRKYLRELPLSTPFRDDDYARLKALASLRNLPHFYGATFDSSTPHDFYHNLARFAPSCPFSILKTGWDGQKYLPGREVIDHVGGTVFAPSWPTHLLENISNAQMVPKGISTK